MNVCPECHTKIYNPSASFCYKCGIRLDNLKKQQVGQQKTDPIADTPFVTKNIPKASEESLVDSRVDQVKSSVAEDYNMSKRWNYFVVGVNALSILFLVVALGMFFRAGSGGDFKSFTPVVEVNNIEIDDAMDDLFDSTVLKSEYYKVVPSNTTLYIESSNLNEFIQSYLSEEEAEYLEATYELKLSDFLVFLNSDYAFIKNTDGDEAVLVRVNGFDFFERTYSKYQENKTESAPLITKRVGEYLVISKSQEYINAMDDVVAQTEKSINQETGFTSALNSASGKPLMFLYSNASSYDSNELEADLAKLDLVFLHDDTVKAGASSIYVVKEGTKYLVKPAS
jgi:hypothetical protein